MGTGAVFIAIFAILASLFGLCAVFGIALNHWYRAAEKQREVLDKWEK